MNATPPIAPPRPLWWGYREVCAALCLSRRQVEEMVARGIVPRDAVVRVGVRVLFRVAALERWAATWKGD